MSWPSFLAWQYGWLFLLVAPLVVFYFLKLRRPHKPVPSLMLWQQVINDQRVNSPFQRFKRNLLLLLQLLLLISLILAAMQPIWNDRAEQARFLPLLIDASASMAARDSASGLSRLDLAKKLARNVIDNLLPDQRVSLIAVTSTGQRLTSFTNNKRELRTALDAITVQDVPSELDDALRMTQAMARSARIESVMLVTDGNLPERVDFELPFDINYQQVGKSEPNLGITALSARRQAMNAWQVFLRVDAALGTSGGAKVQLRQGDTLLAEDFANVRNGDAARLVFTLNLESAVDLQAVLIPDGPDALDADNRAYLQLPAPRALRVYCPPSLVSFRHALSSLPQVHVDPGGPTSDPDTPYDLWIGEGEYPTDFPRARVRLFLGTIPTPLQKMLQAVEGPAEIVDWQRSSPLLEYVQLTDVVATDATLQSEATQDSDYEELGYEVLIHGKQGPLAVREAGQSYESYHLLFHPDRSTLVYRVGFPILVMNAVRIAERAASLTEISAGSTGLLASRLLRPEASYRIQAPHGPQATATTGKDGHLLGVAAPRVGQYAIVQEGNTVATAGASLLSSLESSLVSRDELQFREGAVTAAESQTRHDRPLWALLTWVAFALLLIEWAYFHRRRDSRDLLHGAPVPNKQPPARPGKMVGSVAIALAMLWSPDLLAQKVNKHVYDGTNRERHGMRAEFDQSHSKHRTAAPVLAAWKVEWERDYLLEGYFRLECFVDNSKYQQFNTDDFVLTKGERIVRLLLPMAARDWYERHWIKLTFVGREREFFLGEFDIDLPSFHRQCSVVTIASPPTAPAVQAETEIARHLRYEVLLEQDLESRAAKWLPKTMVIPWEVDDMPLSSMYYTPFDLAFLGSGSLAAASANQLAALDGWVRAGGRLCVCVGGKLLPHQERQVQHWLSESHDGAQEVDPGDAWWETAPPTGMWIAPRGLGKVALVPVPSGTSVEQMDVDRMHRFLWGLGSVASRSRVERESRREAPQPSAVTEWRRANRYSELLDQLNTTLVPSDVRVVPLQVTGCLLALFVCLIGPVDYFVLRALGWQKWTWFTFPALTIATALLCIRISSAFLSTQQEGAALVIRDLDRDGRLLLQNRFQMTFVGAPQTTRDDVQGELFNMLEGAKLVNRTGRLFTSRTALSQLKGTIPTQYQIDRQIGMWSPRLDRYMQIPPAVARTDDQPAPYADVIALMRDAIHNESQASPDDGRAMELDLKILYGGPAELTRLPFLERRSYAEFDYADYDGSFGSRWGRVATRGVQPANEPLTPSGALALLTRLSSYLSWDQPLPQLATRDLFEHWDIPMSPHGGADFQDLAIFDLNDPQQGLALMARSEQGTMVVYRYRFAKDKP